MTLIERLRILADSYNRLVDVVAFPLRQLAEREAEIARLRAVVDAFPKTADGVDATEAKQVFICVNGKVRCGDVRFLYGRWSAEFSCGFESSQPIPACYSTPEAAEAAAREGK